MKKLFTAALLALPLLAASARADGCGAPSQVQFGGGIYFRVNSQANGFGAQLAPWYTYWPLEAHFQTPAPVVAYPYWPVPAGPPAGPAFAPPPPALKPAEFHQSGLQPAGYYPSAPAYWYGR